MRLLLIVLTILTLNACGEIENSEEYKAGYDAGHDQGYDEGYDSGAAEQYNILCQKIEDDLNSGARDEVCD